MAFPRFFIAGGLNTAATYVIYLGLLRFLSYPVAYTVTYALGIALGYWLNTVWVFRKKASIRTAAFFPLTYGVQYLLGFGLLWLLVDWLGVPAAFAPLIVTAISFPVMYLLTRKVFNMGPDKSRGNDAG